MLKISTFMKRRSSLVFFISCLVVMLPACQPSHTPPATSSLLPELTFGDGDLLLGQILNASFTEYDVKGKDVIWSGSGGRDNFSVSDSVVVKNVDISTISSRLHGTLQNLLKKRGWDSNTIGRIGDSYLEINYEENGGRFYFDFLLTQVQDDVRILVLHKGVLVGGGSP